MLYDHDNIDPTEFADGEFSMHRTTASGSLIITQQPSIKQWKSDSRRRGETRRGRIRVNMDAAFLQ